MKKIITPVLFLLISISAATITEAITIDVVLNGTTVLTATSSPASCTPPAGGTCTRSVPIPAGDYFDGNDNSLTIFEGGEAFAEAVDGSGNRMSVTGLVYIYNGPQSPGTVQIRYSNTFLNVNTNTSTGRVYAHNATGNFCRIDLGTGDCLTAEGSSVTLTSTATLEEAGPSTRTSTSAVGQGLAYTVPDGGLNNNDFNPDKFVPIGDPVTIKCPFTKGQTPNCETFESVQSTLNFTVEAFDAVFLLASPQALSGPNTAVVQNLLNTNQKIDVQPSGLDNNDYNGGDNGRIWVEALAGEGFNPCEVSPNSVGLSIGRSDFVPVNGQVQDRFDTSNNCAGRRFQFRTTDLIQAGATQAACEAAPVAVLVGSAEFTSSFTQSSTGGGKGKKGGSSAPLPSSCQVNGNIVTCTEDLQWSGSQSVTCSVPSGG